MLPIDQNLTWLLVEVDVGMLKSLHGWISGVGRRLLWQNQALANHIIVVEKNLRSLGGLLRR